jgi:SAM-dependent methyltransferase
MTTVVPRRRARPYLILTPFRLLSAMLGDPRQLLSRLAGIIPYARNLWRFWRLQTPTAPALRLDLGKLHPRLSDRFSPAGSASGHYFHQDIWAARHIYEARPQLHVDIGSRVDGFISHLLVFRDVYVLDVRPIHTNASGFRFIGGDARRLPFQDDSIASISSLHAIEHIGLGRYGDAVDPQGSSTAIAELARVLAPLGRLYFSVPVGRERLEFDAHRIFRPSTILDEFAGLKLIEFAAVDDDGSLVEHVAPSAFNEASYACGLFLFEKPPRHSASSQP